jgi:hypothetical protein
MLSRKWLALAAWASLPIAAAAQQDPAASRPDHAKTHAGAIAYQSAFEHYRAIGDESETPDAAWRAANDEMAKLGGHAGHMKNNPDRPEATPTARDKTPAQGSKDHRAHGHGRSQ